MTDDAEKRRRRAAYRACHRGTKEMDWILGRFAEAKLPAMAVERLGLFERMLSLPDPDLQDMILHPELAPAGDYAELVAAVRAFHGLEGTGCMNTAVHARDTARRALPPPPSRGRTERRLGRQGLRPSVPVGCIAWDPPPRPDLSPRKAGGVRG
jgi:antitoxin CptB